MRMAQCHSLVRVFFAGLVSLKVNAQLADELPATAFQHLRHLCLPSAITIPPTWPALATVTHLTFDHMPEELPPLGSIFPSLTDLRIEHMPTADPVFAGLRHLVTDLARALPPTLKSFATLSHVDRLILSVLPDRLDNLTIVTCPDDELFHVLDRWFPSPLRAGAFARTPELRSLTLVTLGSDEESDGESDEDSDNEFDDDEQVDGPLGSFVVQHMQQAGCVVTTRSVRPLLCAITHAVPFDTRSSADAQRAMATCRSWSEIEWRGI